MESIITLYIANHLPIWKRVEEVSEMKFNYIPNGGTLEEVFTKEFLIPTQLAELREFLDSELTTSKPPYFSRNPNWGPQLHIVEKYSNGKTSFLNKKDLDALIKE